MKCSALTVVNGRKVNQDAFVANQQPQSQLYGVADGHGGDGGEVVSQYGLAGVSACLCWKIASGNLDFDCDESLLGAGRAAVDAGARAVARVKEAAGWSGSRPGTTLSFALAVPGHKILYANVGDSPILAFTRSKGLFSLSRSHGIIEELERMGVPKEVLEEQQRLIGNIILKSLGKGEPFVGVMDVTEEVLLLIGSDGALAHLPHEQILSHINESRNLGDLCNRVGKDAMNHTSDNVTLIVAQVTP